MKNIEQYSLFVRIFPLNRILAAILIATISCSITGKQILAQKQARQNNPLTVSREAALNLSLKKYAVKLAATVESENDFSVTGNFKSEIKKLITALSERDPVNPIIVSENGLAVPQMLQALVAQLADVKTPEFLQRKQIYWLNVAALHDAVKSEGELIARWSLLLSGIKQDKRIILFVPDLAALIGETAPLPTQVREMFEGAIASGNLRVIGTAPHETAYLDLFGSHPMLGGAFVMIKSGVQNKNASKNPKSERDEHGFVGAKMAPDLQEMINRASGEKLRVIAQVSNVESPRLSRLLHLAEATVKNKIPSFGALEIEIPAQNIPLLEESKLLHYLSPNREASSLGHLSKTVGLDQVLTQSGQSGYKGTGVGIAIVDSGIARHSAFYGSTDPRVVYEADFTGNNNGFDGYGHGTHVASVAAGKPMSDGDDRFTGIAQDADVIGVRVLGGSGRGQTAWLLKGLDWILSNRSQYNIRVVNLSLGVPAIDSYKNDVLCRAVRKLVDHGIVVVVAAGNDGKDSQEGRIYGRVHSPGNEPSAITVGASNTFGTDERNDDAITSFSSRGPTRSYWKDANNIRHYDNLVKPDLVAPGNKIIAAQSSLDDSPNSLKNVFPALKAKISENPYREAMYLSGTSVAAPVVAGAVAVMLQANPHLTPNMVKAALQYTAQPLANANTFEQGAGQINLVGAMQIARLMRRDMKAKFATDLSYTVACSGSYGVEKDRSVGDAADGDGTTITLNGVTYAKGFGVRPGLGTATDIRVRLNGNHQFFMADIGVDDEVEGVNRVGSVVFQVWADGAKLFDSGVMSWNTATKSIRVDVAGKNELRLVVTDAGDGAEDDHANWAAARLTPRVYPSDNLLMAALPAESSNIGVGASFGWSRGIIFNHHYAVGTGLMTKSNRVYGEGWLLGDGVSINGTTAALDTELMTLTGIVLGTQIKTNLGGGDLGTGANLTSIANLLGGGTLLDDGTTIGGGTVMCDDIILSDGTLISDSLRGQSILANGDNTPHMTAQ